MEQTKTNMTIPERLAKMEEKVDTVKDDVAEIKELIKGLDKKFASKTTEKIVYGVCVIILVFFVNRLLTLSSTKTTDPSTSVTISQPSTSTTTATPSGGTTTATPGTSTTTTNNTTNTTPSQGGILQTLGGLFQ